MGKSKDLATGASYQDQTESDARYANVSGDTFTGTVTVTGSTNTNTTLNVVTPNWVSGAYADFNLGYQPTSRKVRGHYDNGIEVFTNNANAALKVDPNGRVTMPYQPAFYVYHNGSQSVLNTSQPIVEFNAKISDVGNHFNTSTYTYTAPVSGWYHFDATVSYSGSFTANRIIAYIRINGTDTASRQMYRSGQDTGVNVSASRYLSANDTVRIKTYQDSGSTRNIQGYEQWTHFSGYLIG